MSIKLPYALEVLPKEIQKEYLEEMNKSPSNIDRFRWRRPDTLYGCINCVEWSKTKKGGDYWCDVSNGKYNIPSYQKYLK